MGPKGWRSFGIAPCDLDGHDLAMVVDGQMELEAQEPVPGGVAPPEHLILADLCKAVAELLHQAIAAEMLEILAGVGGEREEHQDEAHLTEGGLSRSLALTA